MHSSVSVRRVRQLAPGIALALAGSCAEATEAAQVAALDTGGIATQIGDAGGLPPAVAGTDGSQLVDASGRAVALHGFSWFGFNNGDTMVSGLWGQDPVGSDFARAVHRQKLLGFNAVRLPFSFKDLSLPPRDFTSRCGDAALAEVVAAVTDPEVTGLDPSLAPGPLAPPLRQTGTCNDYLPQTSTRDRLLWVVDYYLANGFYVLLDNHLREDSTAVDDPGAWAQAWANLAGDVLARPNAPGRVFFDLLNEPDDHQILWQATATTPGLTDLFLRAMDAISAKSSRAVFFVEGTGQLALGTNWGDGFATDAVRIAALGLSDPRPFFTALAGRAYGDRVVLSPHVYGPKVTGATRNYAGQGLFTRLDASFGTLMTTGFCVDGACRRFPVAIGEFGSTFVDKGDLDFMTDFASYLNVEGAADSGQHAKVDSWFYWDWNANSGDTGGLVEDDWRTTEWVKVRFLVSRLGLAPWWKAAPAGTSASKLAELAPSAAAAGSPPPASARPPPAPASVRAPASASAPGAPVGPKAPPAAGDGCQVRAEVGRPWAIGAGWATVVNLYLSNQGPVAIPRPYVLAVAGTGYREVLGSWNLDAATLHDETLAGLAAADWQGLAPARGNEVNVGFTVRGAGDDLAPREVSIQGQVCALTVVRAP